MGWGYPAKLRQFGKSGPSNVDNAINQGLSNWPGMQTKELKWSNRPTSSFSKANELAGSGGHRSKQRLLKASKLFSSRSSRQDLSDEDF
jgi:hypothetical protein